MELLKYRYYEFENGYSFIYSSLIIAERIYETKEEFNNLMINEFNAKFSKIVSQDIEFEKEEDIKTAIKYLESIIESAILMEKLINNI